MTIGDDVLNAYYAYNDVLIEMVQDGVISQDLDSCYGRFHSKALRIAMLLASMASKDRIELKHWAYAQEVAEQWRLMLHQLVETAGSDMPSTREEMLDEKIES